MLRNISTEAGPKVSFCVVFYVKLVNKKKCLR